MPITPTYPGVYIEEIPSGVRTITGVSTSVAAFVGSAKRGPINKAVRILSYADFERNFGGLDANSDMSYAVRQFFLNGGSDAWVIRLAQNAIAAKNTELNGSNFLHITAADEGQTGNNIEVWVDYQTDNPASTFNLTINYVSPDNPTDRASEMFKNLSMNSQNPRYVEKVVNGTSKLVTVQRNNESLTNLTNARGTSTSGKLTNVATLVDETHNQLQVSVDGAPPVTVKFAPPYTDLSAICNAIATKVAIPGFTCQPNTDADSIIMTSGTTGEISSVRVLPSQKNDVTARLKLGTLNGGQEVDAAAAIRPPIMPDSGRLKSGAFTARSLDNIPSSENNSFLISLDGYGFDTITLESTAAAGANLGEKLKDIASRIQTKVCELKPNNPAYKNFQCVLDTNNRLLLMSGTRGVGSSVSVKAAGSDLFVNSLNLLVGATQINPTSATLQGGTESPYKDEEAYNLFIADRSQRKGIYALESVDVFNLLCLPGVFDPGILMDADSYCKERRAFLIADAPKTVKTVSDMVATASGTALPKTEYGAVYYPWVYIADPLNNGKLRLSPPSGTIAGLYARTDSGRGVWKAPAGTEATLTGVQAVDYKLTDPENGTLNPLGVNCIRLLPVFGVVAWGARTLRGADQMTSEYKYIPVRRLALYIEESLYRGTQWVVFEPNDEPLWAQIRLNLGAFMHNLFRQGAFQGKSPREAYFVKCDSETTTQNDINLGIVNIVVGFAPLKPAEFVIIQLQQMAGQIQA